MVDLIFNVACNHDGSVLCKNFALQSYNFFRIYANNTTVFQKMAVLLFRDTPFAIG